MTFIPDIEFIEKHKIDFHDFWDEVNNTIANAAKQYFETFYAYEFGPGKDMTPEKQFEISKRQYFNYLDYFNFNDYHIISFDTIMNPYFGLDVYKNYVVDIPPLPEGNVYLVGEYLNYVTIKLYEYINKKYMDLINSKDPKNKVHRFHYEKNNSLTGNILQYDGENEDDINILEIPFLLRFEGNTWNVYHNEAMTFTTDNYPEIPIEKDNYLLIFDNGHIASMHPDGLVDQAFGKVIIE